jgi:hypothetical protein
MPSTAIPAPHDGRDGGQRVPLPPAWVSTGFPFVGVQGFLPGGCPRVPGVHGFPAFVGVHGFLPGGCPRVPFCGCPRVPGRRWVSADPPPRISGWVSTRSRHSLSLPGWVSTRSRRWLSADPPGPFGHFWPGCARSSFLGVHGFPDFGVGVHLHPPHGCPPIPHPYRRFPRRRRECALGRRGPIRISLPVHSKGGRGI